MHTDMELLYDCKQAPQTQSWTIYACRHHITVQLKTSNYSIINMKYSAS